MREFVARSLTSVAEELAKKEATLVACHQKPDGDCIGSAFALKALLGAIGVRAWVVCSEELPGRLAFLSDGEQTSILPESVPEAFQGARVVAVDVASPAQAGRLFPLYEADFVLMLDHHARGTAFADHYVLPDAAATGEIVYRLACELQRLGLLGEIPSEAVRATYAAISSDTGCFKYSNVTPETHEIAAELLRLGVDAAEINRRLFASVPRLQMLAEGEAIRRAEFFCDGRVGAVSFPYALKAALGLRDEHLETVIDTVRVVEGVEIAFVVKQPTEEPIFRVSMRSAGAVDVAEICAVFGGGGHAAAAGATITDPAGIDSALLRVLGEIKTRL